MSAAEATIFDVAALDFNFQPLVWRFAIKCAGEIAAHWRQRREANPALFDGRVLLLGEHRLETRVNGETILRGGFFETDYSAFLAWRDFGFPDSDVCNCFSMAALRAADGPFLLGEMGPHTANAGSIYFAAGTPDRADLFDGKVDLAASVQRELREETGLGPDDVTMAPGWTIVYAPPRIACMKPVFSRETAQAMKARIERFLASESQPELARMHVVSRPEEIDAARSPGFIVDYLKTVLPSDQS